MKDHIDLDSHGKKPPGKPPGRDLKEIAGSFWLAASIFSKKLQKWRRKKAMATVPRLQCGPKSRRVGSSGRRSWKLQITDVDGDPAILM
uniref:Uncharacterized protein n=1 Tax=Nelumbo nucifera TaxID=4432 RepID=A0A822YEX5_NELNU|nr:TPA_asm: hypothetical protein HUJ06_029536 [Nelumbo nucifera]